MFSLKNVARLTLGFSASSPLLIIMHSPINVVNLTAFCDACSRRVITVLSLTMVPTLRPLVMHIVLK